MRFSLRLYKSQGVSIHDKHIEIILRQMLRRVQVESTGDTDYIPGQMVDKFEFQEKNAKVLAEGGEPATAKSMLLGVTRASLLTDSFLSAASFQETTRVLTQAAVSGAQDWLQGLKENVIIGRLIPARITIPGMDKLLEPEPVPELAGVAPGGWLGMGPAPEAPEFPASTGKTSTDEADLLADVANFFGAAASDDDAVAQEGSSSNSGNILAEKEASSSSTDLETSPSDGEPQE